MRRDPDIGHSRSDRSPNIVYDPPLHLAAGVERKLVRAPTHEPVARTRPKQLVTGGPMRNSGQDIECDGREWQAVGAAVLAARSRDGPGPALEIELAPAYPAYLLPAAA